MQYIEEGTCAFAGEGKTKLSVMELIKVIN